MLCMHLGNMYNQYVTSQNMKTIRKMSECAYLPSVSIEKVKRKGCYKLHHVFNCDRMTPKKRSQTDLASLPFPKDLCLRTALPQGLVPQKILVQIPLHILHKFLKLFPIPKAKKDK